MKTASPRPEAFKSVLGKSFLFSCLNDEEVSLLAGLAQLRHADDKEVIFHKGTIGEQMFAVVRGAVKISTHSEGGREIILGILAPGEFFGEIALFDGQKRTASATAIGCTDLWLIEKQGFLEYLEQHPHIAIQMLRAMARRLRMADGAIEDTTFLSLPARLAKKLVTLAQMFGEPAAHGTRINLKLSQQELANMVGASREAVNKQIRTWADAGMVSLERNSVLITDPRELEKLVN